MISYPVSACLRITSVMLELSRRPACVVRIRSVLCFTRTFYSSPKQRANTQVKLRFYAIYVTGKNRDHRVAHLFGMHELWRRGIARRGAGHQGLAREQGRRGRALKA